MAKQLKPIHELLQFGILNIDKPAGPTSFTISDYIRKKLKLNKTSHFGTLDPQVTGVLPIALGRACKLTGFFLGHDKEYIGVMHTHKEQDMEELQKIIQEKFTGVITQLPPVKSAVKRQEREREIMKFQLIEASESKKDFLFIAEVQGGTYIRKLCSDLGEIIGGAHMLELRRIRAGIIKEDSIVNLYDFDKAVEKYENGDDKDLRKMIMPAEEAIKKVMPYVEVRKSAVKHLLHGKPLFKEDVESEIPEEKTFAVFSSGKFIEIVEKTEQKGADVLAKALFVFN
jgi:H/ACA ribonucleoprotein complex subunit 4